MTFQTKWREWPPTVVAVGLTLLIFWWASGLFLPLILLLVVLGGGFILTRQGFAAIQKGTPRRQATRRGR